MFQLTEAQLMMRRHIQSLAPQIEVLAKEADEKEELSRGLLALYKDSGFFSFWLPKEFGGEEGDVATFCLCAEELAKIDASSAMVFVELVLVSQRLLGKFCNAEQRQRYFPQVALGNIVPAVSMTEPEAGSDVAAIKTRAKLNGDHYVINGTKRFCTLGPVADILVVITVTDPAKGTKGFTAFIVEKGIPGFHVDRVERKMGLRGTPTSDLIFDDAVVPVRNRLGKEGDGFAVATSSMNEARAVDAALSVGLSQGALDYAVSYAKQRVQFGKPIAAFQGLQFMMADMAIKTEAARCLTYKAVDSLEAGAEEALLLCSMAKCFSSDVAMAVTTDAVQVLGGYGYIKDHPVERKMRDAKVMQILEGTNQIQRRLVARKLVGRFC